MVVGGSGIDIAYNHQFATLWKNGTSVLLGSPSDLLSSSFAWAINNSGVVVGYGYISGAQQAIQWVDGIASLLPVPAGTTSSKATGINSFGDVVGVQNGHAVIWKSSLPYDLFQNSDAAQKGWSSVIPSAINDSGQIVGTGVIGGQTHGFLLSPSAIQLVDPHPTLLIGVRLTGKVDALATEGTSVRGAVSDGTALLLIRIKAQSVGQRFSLSLQNQDNSGDIRELGGLSKRTEKDQTNINIDIAAESTSAGPVAFALYRAPIDFAWRTAQTSINERSVVLNFSSGDVSQSKTIVVGRPPTILVHGLWASQAAWDTFEPLVTTPPNSAFQVFRFDYEKTNGSHLNVNSNKLIDYIESTIDRYSESQQLAIGSVDFVAHSMGGVVVRTMPNNERYYSARSYGRGWVHKLITLGSPHLGTPIARELRKTVNSCMRLVFDAASLSTFGGAITDLVGDGDGDGKSDALVALKDVPIAFTAGRLAIDQFPGLSLKLKVAVAICKRLGLPPPLADQMTQTGIAQLLSPAHDGMVPLSSALNNKTGFIWGDGITFGGVHSDGTEELGFVGPILQGPNVPTAQQSIILLNTPISDAMFFKP